MDALKFEQQAAQLRNTGKGYEAAKVYSRARQAYVAEGNLQKAAGCQHMVGVSYKIENDLNQAMTAYQQAMPTAKKQEINLARVAWSAT